MKILHICQRDDPSTGGAVRVAVELARHLPCLGVESKLVFAYGGPGPFATDLPNQSLYLTQGEPLSVSSACLRLFRLLRDEKPDIIHHHDGLTWTYLVTRLYGKAPLITHGHLTAPAATARWRDRLSGAIHRMFSDKLVAVSSYVAITWLNAGCAEEKMVTIPNAVDSELFRPPDFDEKKRLRERFDLPVDAQVICFVGRLHNEVKCCDDFIKVLAHLPESYWGLIAGSGPDDAGLKQLAEDLKIDHRVRFVGFINPPLTCYQASDLFLMTSNYEPFGMVVLEAAACGLPVVGLPAVGGVESLIGEIGGVVIPSRNSDEIATVIHRLLIAEGSIAASKEARASIIADHFNWMRTTCTTHGTYQRLLCTVNEG